MLRVIGSFEKWGFNCTVEPLLKGTNTDASLVQTLFYVPKNSHTFSWGSRTGITCEVSNKPYLKIQFFGKIFKSLKQMQELRICFQLGVGNMKD